MEKNKLEILQHKLEFLKFALSNTVDPINVIHLEGQIREIEDEIENIQSNEFQEQVTTDFSPPPHETETYKKIMNVNEMGMELPKLPKNATDNDIKTYRETLLKALPKSEILKKMEKYHNTKKKETKEQTMASSSGSFEAPAIGGMVKRKINNIPNMTEAQAEVKEVTDASSSGAFDVPAFGKTTKGGRKNPLKIDGVKSIAKSRAVKDKYFPKWGGPESVFVKVKEKCKKFPYCNQGDINAIEPLRESIENAAKKYGLPISEVENIVLNEIKQIFI